MGKHFFIYKLVKRSSLFLAVICFALATSKILVQCTPNDGGSFFIGENGKKDDLRERKDEM